MKTAIAALLCVSILGLANEGTDFYALKTETITGETIALEQYKGKLLLIVNTASQCGYTPQYEPLQELYQTYKDRGFVVLGFPSNDYGRQEPGSNNEIATFCESEYGVTFPMFAKSNVKDFTQNPIYEYLTTRAPETGPVKWNFEKFLVDRNGTVIARFGSSVKPTSAKVKKAIEAAL